MSLEKAVEKVRFDIKIFNPAIAGARFALGVYGVDRTLREFDARASNRSLAEASRWLLQQFNIDLVIHNCPLAFSHPGKPVVAIGNHPSLLEEFGLAGSVERNDFFLIGNGDVLAGLGSGLEISKRVLPVIPMFYAKERRDSDPKWLRRNLYRRTLTEQEITEINNASYDGAAERLTNNAVMGIYPYLHGKWFDGLSRILKRLPPETLDELILSFAFYTGLERDKFNELRNDLLLKRPFRKKTMTITYADPIRLRDLTGNLDIASMEAKDLTEMLKVHYNQIFDVHEDSIK